MEHIRGHENLSTAFEKQYDTITNTQELVQGITRQQDTLTTAVSTQHTDLKNHLSLHTSSQSQSSQVQAALIGDTKTDVKDMSGQISLLMTLQRSMAESVQPFLDVDTTLTPLIAGRGVTPYQRQMFDCLIQNIGHTHTMLQNQTAMIQNQQETLTTLREINNILRIGQSVPSQVLLSTPVILLDACGRYTSFHLEFVDCAEVRLLNAMFCEMSKSLLNSLGFDRFS